MQYDKITQTQIYESRHSEMGPVRQNLIQRIARTANLSVLTFGALLRYTMHHRTVLTRKRAIAKALHLEGHSDFAPVDVAYYQHFLCFFCWQILRFGKFRLANTNTELLT